MQVFSVCAVDLCLLSCTGWIIHLQADEKRAGKVRSAEVEWPWFLLAAGHPAVAVVIIHTSQMAFPWASMKRTGQGLSCQVLPGSETTLGQCGTWRVRECFGSSRDEKLWWNQVEMQCDYSHGLSSYHTLPLIALWELREKATMKADLKDQLDFPLENLGSVPSLPATVIPLLIFGDVATLCSYGEIILRLFVTISQRCFQTLLHESKRQWGF